MNHRWFLLLSLVLACAQAESPAPAAELAGTAPAVPVLIAEPPVIPPLDAYPSPFGMGPGPTFLTRARAGSSGALIWFGSDRAPMYFARTGDGPGEVRGASLLNVTDSMLIVFDFANSRFAMWDTTGKFVAQTGVRGTLRVNGPGRASEWVGMTGGAETERPRVIDGTSGRERDLLPAADSFLIAALGGPIEPGMRLGSVSRWDGGFLVANGRSYRIGGYDWEGRLRFVIAPELPPNLPNDARVEELMASRPMVGNAARRTPDEWRERFRTTPEQWFSHLAPPRMDAEGRIWVVGRAHGELFADAWWHDQFLGRTFLDCPGGVGRWNLAGNRIALVCANDDPEADAEQVYRIWRIESDSSRLPR